MQIFKEIQYIFSFIKNKTNIIKKSEIFLLLKIFAIKLKVKRNFIERFQNDNRNKFDFIINKKEI